MPRPAPSMPTPAGPENHPQARSMKTLLIAAALLFSLRAQAEPASVPSAREWHAAQCVAALEVDTERLAAEVKSGRAESRSVLMSRLESGIAFIGDAYLHGTNDEAKARALADNALQAQKGLNADELEARQAACAVEGEKIMAAGNGLERAIVRHVAKRRMTKLLDG